MPPKKGQPKRLPQKRSQLAQGTPAVDPVIFPLPPPSPGKTVFGNLDDSCVLIIGRSSGQLLEHAIRTTFKETEVCWYYAIRLVRPVAGVNHQLLVADESGDELFIEVTLLVTDEENYDTSMVLSDPCEDTLIICLGEGSSGRRDTPESRVAVAETLARHEKIRVFLLSDFPREQEELRLLTSLPVLSTREAADLVKSQMERRSQQSR
jgi:hypothetical protein